MGLLERFEAKYIPEPMSGCWLWIGGTTKSKWTYGLIWDKGTMRRAHHVSWQLFRGSIPRGKWVLHKCDNPPCVNPEHLFIGTQFDNMQDMHAKGRAGDCRHLGEQHGCAKLTTAQVKAIRKSRKTQKELAQKYGVRQTNISMILSRQTWKHV